MLQIEQAVELLNESIAPITEVERIPILQACGRVLAHDYSAPHDQPPFARSPLDGYAVKGEDSFGASRENPVLLNVVGKIYAGEVFLGEVQHGQAVRLTTGAPMPKGSNTVIRQEDTNQGKDSVQIYASSKAWQNYCPQGEDYHASDVLLHKGTVVNGCAIALLASMGAAKVDVLRQGKIAVLSTGDEILSPEQTRQAGKIYDSNRFYVSGRLTELGTTPVVSAHCPDNAGAVAEKIRCIAPSVDLIITTGGVSVGEKDIMHEVVTQLGAKQLFWRVALKPGAPTLAMFYQNTVILCLSGNPYGAAANFELLVRPVLEHLTGSSKFHLTQRTAVLSNDFPKGGGVRRFVRGVVNGNRVQIVTGNQASGTLSSLMVSNCLVEIPPQQRGVKQGEEVKVYLL